MDNVILDFRHFVNEMHNPTCECGGFIKEDGTCSDCGSPVVDEIADDDRYEPENDQDLTEDVIDSNLEEETDFSEPTIGSADELPEPELEEDSYLEDLNAININDDTVFEKKQKSRSQILKDASAKYPNISQKGAKSGLAKMKGEDFKDKAKKNFKWADRPEAAAAAYIRKATKKEPKDV